MFAALGVVVAVVAHEAVVADAAVEQVVALLADETVAPSSP
ncbi:MAG: hypothetical protein P8R42_25205 [Candidatus Binatia bacterium]|nr:hypothetical protein [Candidatus Binatia bacterium]